MPSKEQIEFAARVAGEVLGWKPGPAKKGDRKRTAWVDSGGRVRALRSAWVPQVKEAQAFQVIEHMIRADWRVTCEETPRGSTCEMQQTRGGPVESSFSPSLAEAVCMTALAVFKKPGAGAG